jgi:D-alanyl-D-alanine carboxypeptidase
MAAMTIRALLLTLVATTAPLLTGCGKDEAQAPPVQQVARDIADSGARNVIVSVSDDGTEHVGTAGSSRPSADDRFRIGSVTKTFTAAIVLQLAEEEKLRLDDALDEHLPGVVPRGEEITIRHLLGHRSGLVNFTEYASWLRRASRSSSTRPIDTLRFAASHPLDFEPGSRWSYSNTNYIALGLIIEKVTGQQYAHELEERLLGPLGLDRTELPTTRRLPDLDDAGENPSVPWAAGSIVSNAHDLSLFFSALLSGELLSDASLAGMKRTAGRPSGLGLFSTHLPCGGFWGHPGSILDYATLVNARDDGERVAVISIHGDSPASPPDESELLCEPG